MIQKIQSVSKEFHQYTSKILEKQHLSFEEAYNLMISIIDGRLSPVQVASILSAIRIKGESSQEIGGFSQAMLERSNRIKYRGSRPLLDVVGTGGAPFKTFNVSTTTSFVLPSLGVAVAKHGNRSSTSKSGSADLLEALGVNIEMNPKVSEDCLNKINLTFMFAPKFHPAMKRVVPIRKELGFRTIFNLLGPLTNPCGVTRQLTGVYDPRLLKTVAKSLQERGFERACIVHSNLGADEVTNSGETLVVELKDNELKKYIITPHEFGITPCPPKSIANLEPDRAAIECLKILKGTKSPIRDFVVVNAAMALRVSGKIEDIKEGATIVEEMLDSEKAITTLEEFVRYSGGSEEKFNEVLEKC